MKRFAALMLCIALIFTLPAALAENVQTELVKKSGDLKNGDTIALYSIDGSAFVASFEQGNMLGTSQVKDPEYFDPSDVALFSLEKKNGGWLLHAKEGYLTAGNTGSALYLDKNSSAYSVWAFEKGSRQNTFYLRNEGAKYNGSKQYLEYYKDRVTTYGLRTDGDAFSFEVYRVTEEKQAVSAQKNTQKGTQKSNKSGKTTVALMLTGDLHGAIYHTNYTSGKAGTSNAGLTRIATLIKKIRNQYDNTLLIDVGDTVQGTPLTWYYAYKKPNQPDPAIRAMRTLGYDVWILGNHEFNYGLEILNRQITYAQELDSKNEKQIAVLAANYIDDDTQWEPWTGEAYTIRDFKTANGESVRIGIIGFGTPNIPNWEKPANYEGIAFESFVATWKHYVKELETLNCDLIVAACHAGEEAREGKLIDGEYWNWANQVTALVSQTEGIDLVLGGHTHTQEVVYLKNKAGEKIPVIHAGSRGQALGVAYIEFDNGSVNIKPELLTVDSSVSPDKDLTKVLSSYEEACWDDYMDATLGHATGAFDSPGDMLKPSAFLDLVHSVQLSSCYDKTGYTATKEDDVPPMMSLTAALNTGYGTVLPRGRISMGDMFRLYRFENWLYTVEMTAAEIDAWLEYVAERQYEVNGRSVSGGGSYCDCLGGEGVSYTIDLRKPVGQRVNGLSYKGKELDQSDHGTFYTVVINNYRYTGGGSYCREVYYAMRNAGIDSDLVVYDKETKTYAINDARQVFSTQYGMDSGEDRGQVRSLMADYIKEMGTIKPIVYSNWQVKY